MRGPGSIPTEGNIFHRIFWFSHSSVSPAIIGIIAILVHFEKKLLRLRLFGQLRVFQLKE